MPRFFNKFRVEAIRNSKLFNYLLYAIGEILLVTLGILIAGQKLVDSMTQVILSQEAPLVSIDTITEKNVKECLPCLPYHVHYSPFTPNLKGYEALKGFENNLSDSQDSLTLKILELYSRNVGLIEVMGDRVGDHLMESLQELEQKPWYISFLNREFNKEATAYFISDLRYRNRLATFSLLNSQNYMTFIENYHNQSREIVKEIKERRG